MNLYKNRFLEVLSLIAYTVTGQSNEQLTTSPEFTTHGMLRKVWYYIKNDGIYLFKCGAEGAVNTGRESYSECYAYQVAECIGIKAVHYDWVKCKKAD